MSGKRTTLVSSAIYHNFEENPIFTGIYQREQIDEDGKVIGFVFVNTDGEEMLITNAFAIDKALNYETEKGLVKDLGKVIEITWHGKSKIKKSGREYNRFQVVMID